MKDKWRIPKMRKYMSKLFCMNCVCANLLSFHWSEDENDHGSCRSCPFHPLLGLYGPVLCEFNTSTGADLFHPLLGVFFCFVLLVFSEVYVRLHWF